MRRFLQQTAHQREVTARSPTTFCADPHVDNKVCLSHQLYRQTILCSLYHALYTMDRIVSSALLFLPVPKSTASYLQTRTQMRKGSRKPATWMMMRTRRMSAHLEGATLFQSQDQHEKCILYRMQEADKCLHAPGALVCPVFMHVMHHCQHAHGT